MDVECPICGKPCDAQGVENHIRLTNGDGHGPAGRRPGDVDDVDVPGGEAVSLRDSLVRVGSVVDSELQDVESRVAELESELEDRDERVDELRARLRLLEEEAGVA